MASQTSELPNFWVMAPWILDSALEQAPIDQVILTNTIPLMTERAKCCQKIKQLSVARLLGQAIRSIHEETSISQLFV